MEKKFPKRRLRVVIFESKTTIQPSPFFIFYSTHCRVHEKTSQIQFCFCPSYWQNFKCFRGKLCLEAPSEALPVNTISFFLHSKHIMPAAPITSVQGLDTAGNSLLHQQHPDTLFVVAHTNFSQICKSCKNNLYKHVFGVVANPHRLLKTSSELD